MTELYLQVLLPVFLLLIYVALCSFLFGIEPLYMFIICGYCGYEELAIMLVCYTVWLNPNSLALVVDM